MAGVTISTNFLRPAGFEGKKLKTKILTFASLAILWAGIATGQTTERQAAVGELIEIHSSIIGGQLHATYFLSDKPGRFTIVIIGDAPKTFVVNVGSKSLAGPIDRVIVSLYALVNSPTKRATALELARVCESVTGNTPATVQANFNRLRVAAIGNNTAAWLPFLKGLGKLFDKLDADNKLKTAADYKAAFGAVGRALRGASQ